MNLHDQASRIRSRSDFISFIYRLYDDLQENPGSWENPRLDSFLEAVASWVEDMDGYFENRGEPVPEEPSWRLLGEILLAAKYYE